MKPAFLFVLIVTVCAKYNIVGKFLVTENTCNQEVYNQVTDFYVGATAVFAPVDDVEAYPYTIQPSEVLELNSRAVMDGDRIYLLSREEFKGTKEPTTGLVMIEPDCERLDVNKCEQTDKCKVYDYYQDYQECRDIGCSDYENASICNADKACIWNSGVCEWFNCDRYSFFGEYTDEQFDQMKAICEADYRCGSDCVRYGSYFNCQCFDKAPLCLTYTDAYTCLHNEGYNGNKGRGNCQWDETTKNCSYLSYRNIDTRSIEQDEKWACEWSEEKRDNEEVTFLTCLRYSYYYPCSFTMEYLGSAQSFIVSLAVVGLALVFVLL